MTCVKPIVVPEPPSSAALNAKTEPGDIKTGMVSGVKNLYESKPDDKGRISWVDTYPDNLEAAAENAESAQYALLIRNKKCYDGCKSLQIDSIIVQSPLLKVSLGHILDKYPGITSTLDRLKFSAPFQPFVHRWKNLVCELQQESDSETRAHLSLLHSVLATELKDDLKARDDYILNGVITYDTAWMIFEPGTTVFTVIEGQNRAAKFLDGHYGSTQCGQYYGLNCHIVDWDGQDFGTGNLHIQIWEFQGTKKITKLAAYPFDYHLASGKVFKELVQRGKAFQELSGYHYQYYQGIAIGQGPWGPVRYNVDSRIIIDTYAWNRFNPNFQVRLSSLGNRVPRRPVRKTHEDDEDDDSDLYHDEDEAMESDDDNATSCSGSAVVPDRDSTNPEPKPNPLTEDQLILCNASVKGYSLKDKKWLTFAIHLVKDIKYNDGAFDSLVLPGDHKELILALTESQVANKDTFDDVIQGKGKGMIMLLSGPPGVGKTLTAESVAETMKAPLYMMSAGDLGTSSSQVESALSNVLEMATKWNAILLLDEADVFLEQRSTQDLERNKLVSIFLRILEYYEGILFLTTNRVDNIDAAFQSRIHISMQYNALSVASRKHVWTNFLAASTKNDKHTFSESDLDRLAKYKMNGREIKNVLKTAQLLASKKGVGLAAEHVESVLAIEKRHINNCV